jgi:hypothetical protein
MVVSRPSLRGLRPAVIQPKALNLSIMRRKRSPVGSLRRRDCWSAERKKLTWLNIMDISLGTNC